uniref:GG18629 n=1 Tax=Drosophila erecta TaxID=7220 RepID=B3P1G1_DROER
MALPEFPSADGHKGSCDWETQIGEPKYLSPGGGCSSDQWKFFYALRGRRPLGMLMGLKSDYEWQSEFEKCQAYISNGGGVGGPMKR